MNKPSAPPGAFRPDEGIAIDDHRVAHGPDDSRPTIAALDKAGFAEWDRSQWVGQGQTPPSDPRRAPEVEDQPRWTKWEWISEGQGAAGLRRGSPASEMPEGANALSGGRHNPAMAHWGPSERRAR
ncbi:MAG TPA: hypothetical protein VIV06_10270, partial [Candidatus Limnocylindrales bacterium]